MLSSKLTLIYDANSSVMIQKLDKRALALRLFGRDTDEFTEAKVEDKVEDEQDE
jgi:hypothetical protein